ncbi:MAG TPA: hypothetical protein VJO34_09445, partial [Methylomirabilota bacterium]|nr:hypothetical protein [Methylomirabilota bacterium]
MLVWIVLLPGCAGRVAELDGLEHALDEVGTITVKEPDVWGEARLTKHRQEFEEHLGKRVGTFKEVISARIRRSDAASLTGSGAVAVGEVFAPGEPKPVIDRPDVTLKGLSPGVPPVTAPREEGKTPGPGLEPNEGLRQEQSYIGVNQALRRINAGDDVGQLPGYAVYLLRFPISVMPGSSTRAGYRAQVTLSVRPDVAQINYLLWNRPQAFLAAFVEAIVDGLYRERAEKARMLVKRGPTPPEKETKKALRDLFGADGYRLSFSVQKPPFGPGPQEGRFRLALAGVAKELIEADVDRGRIESVIEGLLVKNREALARAAADALIEGRTKDPKAFRALPDQPHRPLELSFLEGNRLNTISIDSSRVANLATRFPAREEELKDKDKRLALSSQITSEIGKLLSEPTVIGAAKEQYVKIISDREAQIRAMSGGRFDPDAFREALYVEFHPDHVVQVSVLNVPYPFRFSDAGEKEQVNELRRALVSGEVERVRSLVAQAVHQQYTKTKDPLPSLTSAWMKRIGPRVKKYLDRGLHEPLVEGLNNDDEKWFTRTCPEDKNLKAQILCVYERFNPFESRKNGWGFPQDHPSGTTWLFLVEILMRSLYEYETPIRAFALDPVLEEQNALDLFSRRRDLQLAMALAVGSGKITGKAAGDFIKRFELDMDAIALN